MFIVQNILGKGLYFSYMSESLLNTNFALCLPCVSNIGGNPAVLPNGNGGKSIFRYNILNTSLQL